MFTAACGIGSAACSLQPRYRQQLHACTGANVRQPSFAIALSNESCPCTGISELHRAAATTPSGLLYGSETGQRRFQAFAYATHACLGWSGITSEPAGANPEGRRVPWLTSRLLSHAALSQLHPHGTATSLWEALPVRRSPGSMPYPYPNP